MNKIQIACDHDFEMFESEGYKQCTYPECQLELDMDAQDYEAIEITHNQLDLEEYIN